ncbi:hypothetical protein Tco_1379104 [Tanacetum coccineum]
MIIIPRPAFLTSRIFAFPSKMSHLITVETFYFCLVITYSITSIDGDLLSSFLVKLPFGTVYSANLDFASLIWDEFEWQTVERSSRPSKMSKLLYTRFTNLIIDYLLSLNKSIPRRLDSKLHSSQDDHPITKLLNTTNGDYRFGMEVPDAMINDAIKKKAGYKYDMAKKVEIANVPKKLKKDVVPRKTRSLTIVAEAIVEESANETDDADESDMDLSHDNPHGDDDDARCIRSTTWYTYRCSSNKNFNAGNVPEKECSSYTISISKENSLSYNNSPTKLTLSKSKEANAKG